MTLTPETIRARVISLPHRADRRERFAHHAAEQGIEFQFVNGVTGHGPHINISRAHKACIREAQANREPFALVMEDDCWFPSADGYRWWLSRMPMEPFDLYLAGIYSGDPAPSGRIKEFCALHCYLVAERFYPALLAATESKHLDHALAGLGNYHVCLPYAAIQREGFSDNSKKETAYAHHVAGKYRL